LILLPKQGQQNPQVHETELMNFMRRHGRRDLREPCYHAPMRLRTRLNLVVTGLSAAFLIVLIAAEIQSMRGSVREEIEAANRVAAQFLGRLTAIYSNVGGPDAVLQFLQQLGRVRANEVYLKSPTGEVLYQSPVATYKAGREAPAWFAQLLAPRAAREIFMLRGGLSLIVEARSAGVLQRNSSRTADHGLDPRSIGNEPQHDDAGRPGRRARCGGR
jgi:hypothetical protein